MSKLLVIDDCETDHFIIDRLLGFYGLFPGKELCFDAEMAISRMEDDCIDESKLPDVIFLDLFMPEFNGFNFLERFTKLYSAIEKTIHIFVMSCSINPADKIKAEQFPFVKGFFVKPVSIDALRTISLDYNNSLRLHEYN
jgi:CheY-like chemotaxis protein